MLDATLFDQMNARAKEVKTDFLGMGVYGMKLVSVSQEISKSNNKMLKVVIDSGFKTSEGNSRTLQAYYNIEGTFKDRDGNEKPNLDLFVSFMKQCFGVDKFDQVAINKCIGQSLAVATKKDKDGYISFWYAGSIKNQINMQNSYKPKDESNGAKPEKKIDNGPAETKPMDDNIVYDEKGNPIF